jgi:hypothetical protein
MQSTMVEGSCTVEAPCVVTLDNGPEWESARVQTLAALAVMVFCALATMVASWGRRDG